MSKYIYAALILNKLTFERGINDTIDLINKEFPNNKLIIIKYISDGTIDTLKNIINDFISKYPDGARITISQNSANISYISKYLEELKINIPSFSLSASASSVKTLNNVLTYASFDQYSVMSLFLIYKDYQMKNILILEEEN